MRTTSSAPEKQAMNDALCVVIVVGVVILTGVAAAGTSNAVQIYSLIAAMVIALAYFVPSVIASRRRHPAVRLIKVLNLMLGWTLIGWVAILVWAWLGKTTPGRPG